MKLSFIFGTRPEAIKLAPLILAAREDSFFQVQVCVTAQHRQMLDQVLSIFSIRPDSDLDLMRPNQTLTDVTARVLVALGSYFAANRPDMVLVQGDTTTVLCAALAAYYQQIPIGHVEAGLRTWNKFSPFPEEINRVLTTHVADLHFAPTPQSRDNLLREGVNPRCVFVTGNTVIDALLLVLKKVRQADPRSLLLPPDIAAMVMDPARRVVLMTGHRRENFGEGFESICRAIARLADRFAGVDFIYPVHLNPNVRKPVFRVLGARANIHLIEPLDYPSFVRLMDRSEIILTDSGGVQEEAPSLGKPVLVMRDTTERPEAVQAGTVKLVGTDEDLIVESAAALLTDKEAYARMAQATNPYGDGKATGRILDILRQTPVMARRP